MNLAIRGAIAALALTTMVAIPAHAQMGAPKSAANKGRVEINTQIAYKDMIKRLNAAVKAEKMGLVTRASATIGARRQGITIKGNMVVGVYRNDFARRMLEASIDAGIEAPIRFYITERRDGSAKLTYKTPSAVFEPYMEKAEPELKEVARELDTIFAAIAERATAEN